MLAFQLICSFLVWIASGVFIARRAKAANRPTPSPTAAAALGALIFILSAVVLLGGLAWVAQSAGPVKAGLKPVTWLAITALGALFTAGQAEAASLVLRSLAPRSEVTDAPRDPSCTSSSSRLKVKP
ncbi:MAG TPA: hypothetical protein VKT78_00145 [Fimbriimonadaceae bacterium]|nr:hypothetical protein [Fimbriimonadaceae bacterium]